MAKSDRIIKRQSMREELAQLKATISTTQVIIQAEQKLRSAYQAGYVARLKEESEESKLQPEVKVAHEAVPVLNS